LVTHLRATACHLLYGITQCYLPLNTGKRAPPRRALVIVLLCYSTLEIVGVIIIITLTQIKQADTRFAYPGRIESWVDLVYSCCGCCCFRHSKLVGQPMYAK